MSVSAIRQGELSAAPTGTGVVGAASEAFREEYKAPEFTDLASTFIDLANADKDRARQFTNVALGAAIEPSNSKMWESHYQFAKEKFDVLYSDETLEKYSKDEESMNTWMRLVDDLQNEVKGYEAIYEDSFGDPYNADGNGITWADHLVRQKLFGSDAAFWKAQGKKDVSGKDPLKAIQTIDSRQHKEGSVTLDENGWNFEPMSQEASALLGNTNPAIAAELFSYNLAGADTKSVAEYATDKYVLKQSEAGEEAFSVHLNGYHDNDLYVRSAAQDFIDTDELEGFTVEDFISGRYKQVNPSLPDFQTILSDFDDKIINAIKKQRADAAAKERSEKEPTTKQKAFQSLINSRVDYENLGVESPFTAAELDSLSATPAVFDTTLNIVGDEYTVNKSFSIEDTSSFTQFVIDKDGDVYVNGTHKLPETGEEAGDEVADDYLASDSKKSSNEYKGWKKLTPTERSSFESKLNERYGAKAYERLVKTAKGKAGKATEEAPTSKTPVGGTLDGDSIFKQKK